MSATIGAALKKIAVALLSDPKVLKTVYQSQTKLSLTKICGVEADSGRSANGFKSTKQYVLQLGKQ